VHIVDLWVIIAFVVIDNLLVQSSTRKWFDLLGLWDGSAVQMIPAR